MIDERLFWSYVTMWMRQNKCTWKMLATACDTSESTLRRRWSAGKGDGKLTIKEFSCICSGIGLIPQFVLENDHAYATPILFGEDHAAS